VGQGRTGLLSQFQTNWDSSPVPLCPSPVAPSLTVPAPAGWEPPDDLEYPVLVKPNAEGSSKGIPDACVAANSEELQELIARSMRRYEGDLLVEQYIEGREFTVGILGNEPELLVLEPMEIIFRKQKGSYKVYSFEVKRNFRDYIAYRCPPELSDDTKVQMVNHARTVYEAIGCRDFARIDFRLSQDDRVYFIEVNPLPGLAPGYSDFPMIAEFNGISYDQLICEMLSCALKRYETRQRDISPPRSVLTPSFCPVTR